MIRTCRQIYDEAVLTPYADEHFVHPFGNQDYFETDQTRVCEFSQRTLQRIEVVKIIVAEDRYEVMSSKSFEEIIAWFTISDCALKRVGLEFQIILFPPLDDHKVERWTFLNSVKSNTTILNALGKLGYPQRIAIGINDYDEETKKSFEPFIAALTIDTG